MLGFGNVGQAFARLILKKEPELKETYHLQLQINAIATGQHGLALDVNGLDLRKMLNLISKGESLHSPDKLVDKKDALTLIRQSRAQVLLENSPVNYASGQPAIDHIQCALENDMHVVTANKGPVLHAYRELTALADQHHRRFYFESAVMDGAPIFSLFREVLPAARLSGFEGILNSCTNLLLERMEAGETLENAVEFARSIGITETDPSGDIDGWDAAIKVALLINVLMKVPFKLEEVNRTGIRTITMHEIRQALEEGKRWKLVCQAENRDGQVTASVAPKKVSKESALFSINGTSSFIQFKTEELPGLGILESNPGPETTAYGLLCDLLTIVEEHTQ